jgi:hypothetical protein
MSIYVNKLQWILMSGKSISHIKQVTLERWLCLCMSNLQSLWDHSNPFKFVRDKRVVSHSVNIFFHIIFWEETNLKPDISYWILIIYCSIILWSMSLCSDSWLQSLYHSSMSTVIIKYLNLEMHLWVYLVHDLVILFPYRCIYLLFISIS